jgi:hypothetical protein
MLKNVCDECGNKLATLIYFGNNPIPSFNKLSGLAGNQGFCLCDDCRLKDVAEWKNIIIYKHYWNNVRIIIKEYSNGIQ